MEKISQFNRNSYAYKAEGDICNAELIASTRGGTPLGGIFWCEQAMEKYFKHLLVANCYDGSLMKKHKLLPLAVAAGFKCTEHERIILRDVSKMYYDRYPSESDEVVEDPSWEEFDEAYALALKVRRWVTDLSNINARKISDAIDKLKLD